MSAALALELVPERAWGGYDQAAAACAAAAARAAAAAAIPRVAGRRDSYRGGESNRLTADWAVSLLTADDEQRWSQRRIRARARDLARNNAYARHFLTTLAVSVVGPDGMNFEARVRNNDGRLAAGLNDKIEAAWEDWSSCATVDGKLSRVRLERLVLKSMARDGEALVRKWAGFAGNPYRFALEPVDPDQLDETFTRSAVGTDTNEVRMGIEVDAYGAPVAYHLWDRPASYTGLSGPRRRERIPASQIIHLYDQDRANQTRGVSWFAPIMLPLKMLDGYIEAELVAARVSASKMGFFQRKEGSIPAGEFPATDEAGNLQMEANPGSFEFTPEGYELAVWDPNHPNAAFPMFVKGALRTVATGLDMSYNALANDLEGVNFSSMRNGLHLERDVWKSLQRDWIDDFERKVYRAWLDSALLTDQLKLDSRDPRRFLDVKWTPRGWTPIDPLKDAEAAAIEIHSGLTSRTRELAQRGVELDDVLDDLAAEQELAVELGIDITPPAKAAPGSVTDTTDTTGDGAGDAPAGQASGIEAIDARSRITGKRARLRDPRRRVAPASAARNGH
jgi:lambda family phage portal protein